MGFIEIETMDVRDDRENRCSSNLCRSTCIKIHIIYKLTYCVGRFVFIGCSKMFTLFGFTDKELKGRNSICFWSAPAVESYLTE